MPLHKKTVYIREEDLELWAKCPNKSLMVHNALNGHIDLPNAVDVGVLPETPYRVGEPAGETPEQTFTLGKTDD